MPNTVNYNWDIPAVGGDAGAWGGIINSAFIAADAQVFANHAAAAKLASANTFTQPQTINADLILPRARFSQNGNNQDVILSSSASVLRVVNAANTLALLSITDAGLATFAGNVALSAGSLTVNGAIFGQGGAVIGVDPTGSEILRVGGAVRATGLSTFVAGLSAPGGINAGATTVSGNLSSTGQISGATGAFSGAVTAGSVNSSGNVIAAGFAGSGAGLTGLGWSQIGGVPSNVVNAITQAQGDARYRQISASVAWADVSGIPANVTNAITQANGDARYRQLSVAVPWVDVTKPTPPTAGAVPAGVVPYTTPFLDLAGAPPGNAGDVAFTELQTQFNTLRSVVAQLRSGLITAGLFV